MKIVILIDQFPPNCLAGKEIAAYYLAKHLASRGHEIHVITYLYDDLMKDSFENGFFIHRLKRVPIPYLGYIFNAISVMGCVKKIKPDLIHAQAIYIGLPALLIKKFFGIPYVAYGRGSDVYLPSFIFKILFNVLLKNANSVIALTENMKKKIQEKYCGEIFVVPNGIELSEFQHLQYTPQRTDSMKRVLFLGRLHPIKGIPYLLNAFVKVHQEIPNSRLCIVGEGEERKNLESLSYELGIFGFVDFLGGVSHEKIPEMMQIMDILVLPSISEGFPNVVLEAMASGLPVITSRVGGLPDIITEGVNGYLVEPKNVPELAEKISYLLLSETTCNDISLNNLEKAEEFSWAKIVEIIEGIYKKAIIDN